MHDFVMQAAQHLKGVADSIDLKVFFNVPSEGKIGVAGHGKQTINYMYGCPNTRADLRR